jgi:hypothetical protein
MNIVTGGCSYTNTVGCIDYHGFGIMDWEKYFSEEDNYKSWALHLEDIVPDCKVYNTAKVGIGNGYISRAVIYKVNELMEQDKKPDYVFIQLSSYDRKELLLDINDTTSETDKGIVTHFIPELDILGLEQAGDSRDMRELFKIVKLKNNNKLWLKHSFNEDSMMRYYYKYYHSEMSALVETLEHILRLQWFLKLNKINYKMFPGWGFLNSHSNKFDETEISDDSVFNTKEVKFLWGMIDIDNIWFHRNETDDYREKDSRINYSTYYGKYGGITEWSHDNLPFEDCFVTEGRLNEVGTALDEHPSDYVHELFAKEVVSKWINNI